MDSAELQSRIASSPLYNHDLAPASPEKRHWGTYNFAALWISMSVNILTYMLAASLIQGGMDWKQAVATIFLGNVIVLAPMLLNSHPGAKYGIPFPVLARASFGVLGANVAAVLRALVACGWFGIQAWIGGEAISTLLATLTPAWKDVPHGTRFFNRPPWRAGPRCTPPAGPPRPSSRAAKHSASTPPGQSAPS